MVEVSRKMQASGYITATRRSAQTYFDFLKTFTSWIRKRKVMKQWGRSAKNNYNVCQLALRTPQMSGIALPAPETFRAVETLLGGRTVLRAKSHSTLDWIEIIRQGLPAAAVESILKAIQLSQSDLARALDIPERTLARRKREGVLNREESAKLLRLARVVGRANEVFEKSEAAVHWLKAGNASLGGQTPLSLLDTDIGAENVLDTLGRIEHGVFA